MNLCKKALTTALNKIERLTAENDTLRERQDWSRDVLHNINQIWSDEIERLTARIAELESESISDKLKRLGYTKPKHSAYHDALLSSLTAQEKDDG